MSCKLIRATYNIPAQARGGVLTIGNFDGVHQGHQHLLKQVVVEAKQRKVPSVVMTFEPHAFEFFSSQQVMIPRLTRLREKFIQLAKCGVDYVLVLPFNQQMASVSAEDFIQQYIVSALQPDHIIIGDDFRFGHKRQGDFSLLERYGAKQGFTVHAMPTFLYQGERVSSTRVRQALAQGNHILANALLGRPYSMLGRVSSGDQLGRVLGFPTANIFLHRKLTPVHGIYTVKMYGIADSAWQGVANVGERPTVNGTRTLLEVHLLDFNQDIYGRYVEVEFCSKLRNEERYPNLALLTEQIAKDVKMARDYFNGQDVL